MTDPHRSSGKVVVVLELSVAGGALLLLSALTLAGAAIGLVLLAPLILLTSPLWIPAACGIGVGAVWFYRYLTRRHPVGADRVDYARSRIADTARHVKDCARECGGYLHGRVKDAAPGA